MNIKILMLGDIVGEEGVRYLSGDRRLHSYINKSGASLVIANGENSAEGNGISPDCAREIFDAGVDIITGGNHTWRKKSIYPMLEDAVNIIRPANFSPAAPGLGHITVEICGYRILIINLLGQIYMNTSASSPFECFDKILEDQKDKFDAVIVDIHAEATSEKLAFAEYANERAAIVAGTHTHIPTADCRILEGGCGYITDLGMCGSNNGILGVKKECILHKFLVGTPVRFEGAEGEVFANGAIFEIELPAGRCVGAQRVVF